MRKSCFLVLFTFGLQKTREEERDRKKRRIVQWKGAKFIRSIVANLNDELECGGFGHKTKCTWQTGNTQPVPQHRIVCILYGNFSYSQIQFSVFAYTRRRRRKKKRESPDRLILSVCVLNSFFFFGIRYFTSKNGHVFTLLMVQISE